MRNPGRERGQPVVQHRAADLDRIRHRHPIHLYQQVAGEFCGGFEIKRLGKDIGAVGKQAVRESPRQGGSVVLRSRFLDYTGVFMLHCHMMNHEEMGMMQAIEVYKD